MTFSLGDDGTMDTVIVCDDCGQEMRFNYDGGESDPLALSAEKIKSDEDAYDAFIDSCIEDCENDHVCGNDDDE